MKKLFNVLLVLLVISYPFAVFFGLKYFEPRIVSLFLVTLVVVRFLTVSKHKQKAANISPWPPLILGLFIWILVQIFNQGIFIKLYPFFMSMIMLAAFAYTLKNKPSMIERLARVLSKKLPKEAGPYLEKVTAVWCGFFFINGFIALYTVYFTSIEFWTLYNGFISYILMGTLFVVEFIIRQIIIRTK